MQIKRPLLIAVLVLFLLGLGGCPSSQEERLSSLEAEVKTLRQEASARDESFKENLAAIAQSLKSIHDLLAAERKKAESDGGDLDDKAKAFVQENLDKLMDMTRKLLDEMQSRLDGHEDKEEPAAPQGKTI